MQGASLCMVPGEISATLLGHVIPVLLFPYASRETEIRRYSARQQVKYEWWMHEEERMDVWRRFVSSQCRTTTMISYRVLCAYGGYRAVCYSELGASVWSSRTSGSHRNKSKVSPRVHRESSADVLIGRIWTSPQQWSTGGSARPAPL